MNFKNILIIAFCIISQRSHAQTWFSKNTQVRIFSSTPIEDIDAKTNTAVLALNEKSGKVLMKLQIKSLNFPKKLMQEHFNENYMESDKYPTAEFEGVIQNIPDFNVHKTTELKAKGTITIHGVKREIDVPISLTTSKDKVVGQSTFKVKCADYNVEIPKIVLKNIAEDIEVTILSELNPIKK
ncbi:MAG: YceI family protein [Chitinophagales bacterium]